MTTNNTRETMNSLDNVPPGTLQFLDSFEPALKGSYSILVAQTLSAGGASITSLPQQLTASGPRFTLAPSEIHAEFPPDGSSSQFAEVLPHVVLNTRLLPWERNVPGLPPSAPWLALLLFDEGDLVGSGSGAQTLSVDALINQQPATIRAPALTGLSTDELALSCTAITMSSATFAALVPTGRELPYLAHARQVDTSSKVLAASPNSSPDDGVYAVIVANRFPQAGGPVYGQRSIAHLVSLEGFGDLLAGTTPAAPSQAQVMLVSLYSWTFSCLAEPAQTFAGLATNLALSAPLTPLPASSLLLKLPFTPSGANDPATTNAQQRLDSGYVALGFHAQTGEDGFAWYRGPFAPVVPNPIPQLGSLLSVDAAIIYDSTYAVFDHSIAAAWQCGQSLALADQTYATTLMRLRQKANAQLDQMALQGNATPLPAQTRMQQRLGALFAAGITHHIRQASKGRIRLARPARTFLEKSRPRSASIAHLKASLARPEVQGALNTTLAADPDTTAVTNWLGRLQLLCGIPAVHLVPDARMLPPESIRFFFLDPNWIAALTAGALNIGLGSSRELAVQATLTTTLETMAAAAALSSRALASGQPPPPPPTGPTSGILIRSSLISGWPGLTVCATSTGTPIPILRLDTLAPGVLLCLFNGVPDQLVLEEPHEGLEFGVDDNGCVEVRVLAGSSVTTSEGPVLYNPSNPDQSLVTLRSGGTRVLNLNVDPAFPGASPPTQPVDLLGTVAMALNIGTANLGPALFALQMVKGPETVTFCLDPATNDAPSPVESPQ